MPVDPDAYRQAVGRFATGVTVVTTRDGARHSALTANSFTSVSLDPLLVMVGVQKRSRFHAEVLTSGVWGVSVLASDQEAESRYFASQERYGADDPFDGWACAEGEATGAMLLDGALAVFECRTVLAYEGGDHTLLLGEVVSLATPRPDADPLLYFAGRYRSVS
jgi:flavin reductase